MEALCCYLLFIFGSKAGVSIYPPSLTVRLTSSCPSSRRSSRPSVEQAADVTDKVRYGDDDDDSDNNRCRTHTRTPLSMG